MIKYTLTKRGDLPVSRWSGGTTTQLAIYPHGADYGARSFVWRVSTATVEAPESTFTPLPGVSRRIMVLEGRMTLVHEGHYTKELAVGEQDAFMGDWTTRSRGLVTDFNVMTVGGESTLEMLVAEIGEVVEVDCASPDAADPEICVSLVLYFLSAAEITLPEETLTAESGDVLVATLPPDRETLSLGLRAPSSALRVVAARILHK
jgi:environmental stress-induced protein Ves